MGRLSDFTHGLLYILFTSVVVIEGVFAVLILGATRSISGLSVEAVSDLLLYLLAS